VVTEISDIGLYKTFKRIVGRYFILYLPESCSCSTFTSKESPLNFRSHISYAGEWIVYEHIELMAKIHTVSLYETLNTTCHLCTWKFKSKC